MSETCGYCGGTGTTYGSMYDQLGYRLHDEPPPQVCEYCGGSGQCENGDILLPAETRDEIIRRQSE